MNDNQLQQRATERKVYETIVDMVVEITNLEFKDDIEARLRVYETIAENFAGMVRALRLSSSSVLEKIEKGQDGIAE